MNNLHYTPLSLSKKLAELGIEVESEKYYCGGHIWYTENHPDGIWQECKEEDILGEKGYCESSSLTTEFTIPAYTLADLPAVLKAVGEKKGWGVYICKNCKKISQDTEIKCCENWHMILQFPWQTRWMKICELYATSPEKAWEHMEELLDN